MKDFVLTFVFMLFLAVGFAQTAPKQYAQKSPVKIQIYPNPATSFFRIEGADNQVAVIYLYNLIGKRLKTFDPHKEHDFPVNDLHNGLYLVQTVDSNGKVIATNRLTKR